MQAAETQSQGSAVYDRWAPGLECRQHVKGATGRHLGGSSRERGRERTKFPGSTDSQQQLSGLGRALWTFRSTAAPCMNAGDPISRAVRNYNLL